MGSQQRRVTWLIEIRKIFGILKAQVQCMHAFWNGMSYKNWRIGWKKLSCIKTIASNWKESKAKQCCISLQTCFFTFLNLGTSVPFWKKAWLPPPFSFAIHDWWWWLSELRYYYPDFACIKSPLGWLQIMYLTSWVMWLLIKKVELFAAPLMLLLEPTSNKNMTWNNITNITKSTCMQLTCFANLGSKSNFKPSLTSMVIWRVDLTLTNDYSTKS